MSTVFGMLVVIAVLLLMILWKLDNIDKRTRRRFPTAEEEDSDWARSDPMGYWEAHKTEK